MTDTSNTAGETLAASLTLKPTHTELHAEAVACFNLDCIAHGAAWDAIGTDTEALIDGAESLAFADLQERLNGFAESRLSLLQERLRLVTRRQALLQSIRQELKNLVQQHKDALTETRQKVGDGLIASGSGPEDSIAWKRGSTNQARREFDAVVSSTAAVVEAEKALRQVQEYSVNLHPRNDGLAESTVRDELRQFVASRVA